MLRVSDSAGPVSDWLYRAATRGAFPNVPECRPIIPLFHCSIHFSSCLPHPRESYNFMNVPQPLSLVYAKGSCAELRSQLYIALDVEYIDGMTFQKLHDLARETSRLVGGLRAAVYRQKSKAE